MNPAPTHGRFKTNPARLASARAWKLKNKERNKAINDARNAAVRSDPVKWAEKLAADKVSAKKRRDKIKEYDRSRDKMKLRARRNIRDRIYRGSLIRGVCEICGNPQTDAHHEDYSKPTQVRWLCRKHHNELHRHEQKR